MSWGLLLSFALSFAPTQISTRVQPWAAPRTALLSARLRDFDDRLPGAALYDCRSASERAARRMKLMEATRDSAPDAGVVVPARSFTAIGEPQPSEQVSTVTAEAPETSRQVEAVAADAKAAKAAAEAAKAAAEAAKAAVANVLAMMESAQASKEVAAATPIVPPVPAAPNATEVEPPSDYGGSSFAFTLVTAAAFFAILTPQLVAPIQTAQTAGVVRIMTNDRAELAAAKSVAAAAKAEAAAARAESVIALKADKEAIATEVKAAESKTVEQEAMAKESTKETREAAKSSTST